MNHYYYPMQPMAPMQPVAPAQPHVPQTHWYQQPDMHYLLDAAKTGAIIGASGAAAMQLHRYHNNEVTGNEAYRHTLRGAFQVGLAATAGAAVGRMFSSNSVLQAAAALATGTAVMYVLTKPDAETADE